MNIIKRKHNACIYMLRNIKTGDCYIGSTQLPVTSRWALHIRSLEKGTHTRKIQKAWNESNIKDWIFQVLESGISPDSRYDRESYWVSLYNPILNKAKLANTEKIASALTLRETGITLRAIADTTGMSLGWVSKTLNNYSLQSADIHETCEYD